MNAKRITQETLKGFRLSHAALHCVRAQGHSAGSLQGRPWALWTTSVYEKRGALRAGHWEGR